jgi:hypothetical protein
MSRCDFRHELQSTPKDRFPPAAAEAARHRCVRFREAGMIKQMADTGAFKKSEIPCRTGKASFVLGAWMGYLWGRRPCGNELEPLNPR